MSKVDKLKSVAYISIIVVMVLLCVYVGILIKQEVKPAIDISEGTSEGVLGNTETDNSDNNLSTENIEDTESVESTEGSDGVITVDISTVLAAETTDMERKNLIILLNESIAKLNKSGLLMQITPDNDECVEYIYNSKGEAFSQDTSNGIINIHRKDNEAIVFSDGIYRGYEYDTLDLIYRVTELIESGHATVYNAEQGEILGMVPIVVDIVGLEGISDLYKNANEQQAKAMYDYFYQICSTFGSPTINLRFLFNVDSNYNWIDSVACYFYLGGEAAEAVKKEDISLCWVIENIIPLGDWELLEEWYNIDWTKTDALDQEHMKELLGKQYDILTKMLSNTGDKLSNE